MKLQKLTAGLLALSMMGAPLPAAAPMLTVCAADETPTEGTCGENLTWKFDESTGTLTISGEGEMMEKTWGDFKEKITRVVIEDGVTSIGEDAFYGCSGLTTITIPDSVTNIGPGAFYATPWLAAKKAENPLVVAGNVVIDGKDCEGDVVIPDGVVSIAISAFEGNQNLTSVTIPDSVAEIWEYAFYECASLTSVTIKGGEPRINNYTFMHCTSLTSVTIPEGVTSIGGLVFYDTPWLAAKQAENPFVIVSGILIDGTACEGDVAIPDGVTCINVNAFSNCTSITSVTIPDSVTKIGGASFYGCSSLTSVTIPDTVTSIAYNIFGGCAALTSIVIPDSVTSIEGYAFYGCKALTSVNIPDSVTSIGELAFYGCSGLTSVTIPDSVTSIGDRAFSDCTSLTSVTILNPNCEIGDYGDTFSNGRDGENYVYSGTIYGYENSTAQAYAEKYGYTFKSLGAAADVLLGDVNLDGKVDASDAADLLIALANVGAGAESGLTDAQTAAADADGNGTLNAGDAATILQYAAFIGAGGTGTLTDFLKAE